MTRTVFVDATADHSSSYAFFSNDPSTRKLAAAKYYSLGWDDALQAPPMDVDASRVWELATQLVLLADHPDTVVSDTTYDGRPAFRVPVPATDGNPAFVATVDRQYGVTLAVRALQGPTSGGGLTSFHVEQLQVNRPLPASTFSIKPDYRLASSRADDAGLQVKVEDLAKGSPTFHWLSPTALARVTGGSQVVPTTTPSGYRLGRDHSLRRRSPGAAPYLPTRHERVRGLVWCTPGHPGRIGLRVPDLRPHHRLRSRHLARSERGKRVRQDPRWRVWRCPGCRVCASKEGVPASLSIWTDSRTASGYRR